MDNCVEKRRKSNLIGLDKCLHSIPANVLAPLYYSNGIIFIATQRVGDKAFSIFAKEYQLTFLQLAPSWYTILMTLWLK